MYSLTPMKVYMLDRVQDDPRCVARMERMLDAIGYDPGDVVCITQDNLPEVVDELRRLWPPETVPEGKIRTHMRPFVFTTAELGNERTDLQPLLDRCSEGTPLSYIKKIYGSLITASIWHSHDSDQERNVVCWPTYNLGIMAGCPHGGLYCGGGRSDKFIVIALNLEEYTEKIIGPAIEK